MTLDEIRAWYEAHKEHTQYEGHWCHICTVSVLLEEIELQSSLARTYEGMHDVASVERRELRNELHACAERSRLSWGKEFMDMANAAGDEVRILREENAKLREENERRKQAHTCGRCCLAGAIYCLDCLELMRGDG